MNVVFLKWFGALLFCEKCSKERLELIRGKQLLYFNGDTVASNRDNVAEMCFSNNGWASAVHSKVCSLPDIHEETKAREGERHPKRETKMKWSKRTERKGYVDHAGGAML